MDDEKQLVDEKAMQKMSVAPPDLDREHNSEEQAAAADRSGVADEDPLSAHPT